MQTTSHVALKHHSQPPSRPPLSPPRIPWEAAALEAAELCALELAVRQEDGFGHLHDIILSPLVDRVDRSEWNHADKLLNRLAVLADKQICPRLQLASHCGGVRPEPPFVLARGDRKLVGDAGDDCYDTIVSRLFQQCASWIKSRPDKDKARLAHLEESIPEVRGDVVRGALAAAYYAWTVQTKTQWTWESLRGGLWADGELILGSKWFRNFHMMVYKPDKQVRLSLNQGGDV